MTRLDGASAGAGTTAGWYCTSTSACRSAALTRAAWRSGSVAYTGVWSPAPSFPTLTVAEQTAAPAGRSHQCR